MKAKISSLAARVLIEGWYAQEAEDSIAAEYTNQHFPSKIGDKFILDCGSWLVCEADGWYVTNSNPFE